MKRNVYIIGSKGIPAKYGGFETFVEKLTEHQCSEEIQYFVACMKENSAKSNYDEDSFQYHNANCYNIDVPNIGPAKAILYDILALRKAIKIAKEQKDEEPIFYILACRIGPFMSIYKKKIEKLNGKLFINPDGHEWMRKKWNRIVRKYWKYSERLMIRNSDLVICDSKNIEKYIIEEYKNYKPKTTFIAYGTELSKETYSSDNQTVRDWYEKNKIKESQYYLVVGRFVPENNYEIMIKNFMKSNTEKDFVLITNVENNKFYEELKEQTHFENDKRIKFVGTVYNQDLLRYIRINAFSNFHGHEVGGTNPSLLEALSMTKLNLLLDVGFNREVAQENALYWEKDSLYRVIDKAENLDVQQIDFIHAGAQKRIEEEYSWSYIVDLYETFFLKKGI